MPYEHVDIVSDAAVHVEREEGAYVGMRWLQMNLD